MKEILDYDFEKPPSSSLFAKLSFGSAMLSLCLIGVLLPLMPSKIRVSEDNAYLNILWFIALTFQTSVLAGFIFSIISLVRKEKLKYLKWIGISLNFLYVLLIIALMIFVNKVTAM